MKSKLFLVYLGA